MSAPRVVQIAEFDRPHGGSFVPVLDGMLRRAAARGWRTEVVLPEPAGATEWAERLSEHSRLRLAPADVLGSRLSRGHWLGEQLRGDDGPTVLHTHFTSWDIAALKASKMRGVANTSVFWHVHSALPKEPHVVARGVLKFGVIGRGVAGVICPAPNIALGTMQWLAPRDRVHFVPSALSADAYPLVDAADRAQARAELGLPADAKVVLHFGWHNFLKGTDIFLETIRTMVDRDDAIIAVVRGHEPQAEELAAELGLGGHVRFQEPVEESRTLFAAADVVLSSSREEGMAYTVLESVASGTPVVATPIPGHTYIADAMDACRITRRDPAALADATFDAIHQPPAERKRDAERAHAWVADHLSIPSIANRVVDLYEEALDLPSSLPHATETPHRDRPRVIQVVEFANPNPGSFVPMLAAANRAAIASGATAEMIVGDGSAGHGWIEDLRASGAEVRFAPAVGRDGTRRWLREVIEESTGPVILHTHFTGFDLAAAAAAARIPRAKVIWHIHSALNHAPGVYVRNVIKFGVLSRMVDRVLCPSPDLERNLRKRGAPEGLVEFVPNGIDATRFRPATPEERSSARERFGLPAEGRTAVGLAWNWEVKGGELFIRSVAAARRKIENLTGLLVSSDARGGALADELGIDGMIRSVEPVANARELYAAADVMVAASQREGGTPFAVLEALSSGLRVVGSDIAAHRFIADRTDAMVIAPREPAAFAAAIAEALDSPRPTTGLPPDFTLERWADRIGEIYAELSASAPSSSKI